MIKYISILALFLSLFMSYGCSATKHSEANQLARISLDTTVKYELDIQKKIRAETKYYKKNIEIYEQYYTNKKANDDEEIVADYLAKASSSSAELTKEKLALDIKDFLKATEKNNAEYNKKIGSITKCKESLDALNYNKGLFKEIRTELEDLQKEDNALKLWISFGTETFKEAKKQGLPTTNK